MASSEALPPAGRFDRLCQFVEQHPLMVFGMQALLAAGLGISLHQGWWQSAAKIPAPLAVNLPPAFAVDPTAEPARPFARHSPERPQLAQPMDAQEVTPEEMVAERWIGLETLATIDVAAPKGGRTFSASQVAAVERDHRMFLDQMNVAVPGGLSIGVDEDPLVGVRFPISSMSERVDYWIVQSWRRADVIPAPPATDDEFLRRIYLDLTGVIPTFVESRAFLADPSPNKRVVLIESLLAKPAHAEHMAAQWSNILVPMDTELNYGNFPYFERWLRLKFAKNVPYHQIVGELINPGLQSGSGASGLYNARRGMPEELAADTARFLLGVQIQCAQCHNHPFDRWTVDDFKGYVAFFGPPGSFRNAETKPKFLGGVEIEAKTTVDARRALAAWITGRENPYFARATVNRVWGMMFGRGLVDPIDDLNDSHPASHPQLLNELSTYFVASGYDLRGLIRTLARTKTYQLSSQLPIDDPTEGQLFASMAIKNLGVETMIDCLAQVMNDRLTPGLLPPNRDAILRDEFRERFGRLAQRGVEYEGGIPQALWMMNGPMMNRLSQSTIVTRLSDPQLSNDERAASLFLASLSRYPQPRELRHCTTFLEKKGTNNRREALADMLWALLNSAEFVMNH